MPPAPQREDEPGRARGRLIRQIGEYSGLAMTLPAAGLIGYLVGYALDAHFHTGRAFTIVGLLLGCAAGLAEIVRVATRGK